MYGLIVRSGRTNSSRASDFLFLRILIMTAQEIFSLRKAGKLEEAYEEARKLYAIDKGTHASSVMFWTATDIQKLRIQAGRTDEAKKILLALERLLKHVETPDELMTSQLSRCKELLEKTTSLKNLNTKEPKHIQLGIRGEEIAVAYLREKGYIILERDWHSNHRDIDIIAQDNNCTVFIEVKARQNRMFAEPESAVNYHKLKNLRLAINHYIKYRQINNPWRFDVITVVGDLSCQAPEIQHIQDFQLY